LVRNKIISLIWLSAVCFTGYAQLVSPERGARNSIEKSRWDKAESQLRKALGKDSVNAPANYVFALYFFHSANPVFHLDSAYRYVLRSQTDLNRSNERQLERAKRFPVDSTILLTLRQQIDSAAFENAVHINTEDAYLKFLSLHTFAEQRTRAEELRDEVAYFGALKENSYQAFHTFLTKYPHATRALEAREKYERLLYEIKTKDHRLESYESFLKQFPSTPYRRNAEQQIFEQMTSVGVPGSFEDFLKKYPLSLFAGQARNFLYHILIENGEENQIAAILNDSLRNVFAHEKKYIIPFFKDGKYGFLDEDGKETIPPSIKEIDDALRCGNITKDVFLLADKVVAKSGGQIFNGAEAVDDLGFGFLLIEQGACSNVVHKSGLPIASCVDNAKILGGRTIAVQKNNLWRLLTLSGKETGSGEWDDISLMGNVFVFRKNTGVLLSTSITPKSAKTQHQLVEYDEVKALGEGRIWVRQKDLQGVLDASLEWIIPIKKHVITQTSNSLVVRSADGFSFINQQGIGSVPFKNILENESWTAVKNENWRLYDARTTKFLSPSLDSISFTGPFAIGTNRDSLRIFFTPTRVVNLLKSTTIEFIPGKDSTSFLVTSDGEKKTIFNRHGILLFTTVCDKIHYAGSGTFIIQRKDKNKKDKRGLITSRGKIVLQPEFDAIGSVSNGGVSLLKDKKFGWFDIKTSSQIKPEYTKNVNKYNSKYLVAYKEGLYGFITRDNKPHGKFEFDDVRFWNDSVAWVKKNFQWMLCNIRQEKILENNIRDYSMIVDTDDEKVAIIHQDGHYGVISNKRDEIIPPTLNRIINVGSAERPMYFTAKHVEEADIYVVIYYDKNGVLLRRQVYEEEDYKMINCLTR
jgi:hypothetical protein